MSFVFAGLQKKRWIWARATKIDIKMTTRGKKKRKRKPGRDLLTRSRPRASSKPTSISGLHPWVKVFIITIFMIIVINDENLCVAKLWDCGSGDWVWGAASSTHQERRCQLSNLVMSMFHLDFILMMMMMRRMYKSDEGGGGEQDGVSQSLAACAAPPWMLVKHVSKCVSFFVSWPSHSIDWVKIFYAR